jgi:hypothetical protein
MIVAELSPEEAARFSALLDIYVDQSLTLIQRYDKINEYWGIRDITDDSVLVFHECLLEEMKWENTLKDDS